MLTRFGCKFVYCDPQTKYHWDGKRFLANNDDAYTRKLALTHGPEIAAAFNICPGMYSNSRKLGGICGVLNDLTLDRDVSRKMNSNTGLLGFEDGVLELETGLFRAARFDDFVSMSVGYDYPTQRDSANEEEVLQFFAQVHAQSPILEYFLGRLASCLEGGNVEGKGPFWTGASGANGKSTFANLMGLVLGDYAGVLESSQFTNNRSASSPNSQLISIMRCRFVVVEEPDTAGAAIFNWSHYKELTGGSKIQVRDIYKASKIQEPHFTPFFLFNSLPQGSETIDKAVQRRMEMVPFRSEFVEILLSHQFPIDVSLQEIRRLEAARLQYFVPWLLPSIHC